MNVALLLFAMMQVPAQDTTWVAVTRNVGPDTIVVDVSVMVDQEPVDTAFIRKIHEAGAQSAEAALAAYIQGCGCVEAGPPKLFWYGLLALGTYAIRTWANKESLKVDVNVNAEGGSGGNGGDGGDGGDGGNGGDGGSSQPPRPPHCGGS